MISGSELVHRDPEERRAAARHQQHGPVEDRHRRVAQYERLDAHRRPGLAEAVARRSCGLVGATRKQEGQAQRPGEWAHEHHVRVHVHAAFAPEECEPEHVRQVGVPVWPFLPLCKPKEPWGSGCAAQQLGCIIALHGDGVPGCAERRDRVFSERVGENTHCRPRVVEEERLEAPTRAQRKVGRGRGPQQQKAGRREGSRGARRAGDSFVLIIHCWRLEARGWRRVSSATSALHKPQKRGHGAASGRQLCHAPRAQRGQRMQRRPPLGVGRVLADLHQRQGHSCINSSAGRHRWS